MKNKNMKYTKTKKALLQRGLINIWPSFMKSKVALQLLITVLYPISAQGTRGGSDLISWGCSRGSGLSNGGSNYGEALIRQNTPYIMPFLIIPHIEHC